MTAWCKPGEASASRTVLGALSVLAVATALLSGCGASKPVAAADVIAINSAVCGARPGHPHAGRQVFKIANHSTSAAEVDLIDPANGAIYAEVEALGPQTTRPMRVDVGSGAYAFRCLIADIDPVTGPVFRIAGHVSGAPAILPVTNDDLLQPGRDYHAYVTAGLVVLVRFERHHCR